MKFSRRSNLFAAVGSSNVDFHDNHDKTVQNKFSEKEI